MTASRSLLSLLRIRRAPKKGLIDLPRELREVIYGYYFSDCHVRYYELYHLDKKRILVKRAHCDGPKEHNLLAVCQTIREEAMPVLLKQLVQVLIDNADADIALSRMGSQMGQFLQTLIAATPKIVMSRPAEIGACILPNDRTPPRFNRLEHVELFGFYPNLPNWLYQYRKVSMGWSSYVVKIWGWESASRPTKNRKIQLTSAASWLHDITARDRSKLKVTLSACAYDVPPGVSSWTHLYHFVIDLDTRQTLEKNRLKVHRKKDNHIHVLQWECEEYGDFLKNTKRRRELWLNGEASHTDR